MVDPADFLDDHVRICREGELLDDDVIRGACPAQAGVPWLPGIVGAPLRVLPDNVLGEEQHLSWDDALKVRLDRDNPWNRKYMEFAEALVERANGQFPVSHSPEVGPTDLHAILRGHTESSLDLMVEPEKSSELLWRLGHIFLDVTEDIWKHAPRFYGSYFDAQYSLWAPGSIIRMQESATAVYSPELYREFNARCIREPTRMTVSDSSGAKHAGAVPPLQVGDRVDSVESPARKKYSPPTGFSQVA